MGLLGPSFGVNVIESQATGKDIFFVFDLSRSMDAIDIEPTRLEKTKFELIKNIDLLKTDRIGIIAFSSEAYTHTPLTFDRDAIRLFIQKLNTSLFVNNGTDLNSALSLIVKKNQAGSILNSRKTKVIILISDGEDFGKIEPSVIYAFKKNKIKLLTLGVGTPQGGQIREGIGFKIDKSGLEVVSKLNSPYLINLTKKLNGKYFQLTNQVNGVSDLLKEVDQVESNWIDTRKMTVSNNKYHYFVILALILMIIDILFILRTIKI
jgi:Ca-activated chloride channel family protein